VKRVNGARPAVPRHTMLRAPVHSTGIRAIRPQVEITKGSLLATIDLEDQGVLRDKERYHVAHYNQVTHEVPRIRAAVISDIDRHRCGLAPPASLWGPDYIWQPYYTQWCRDLVD